MGWSCGAGAPWAGAVRTGGSGVWRAAVGVWSCLAGGGRGRDGPACTGGLSWAAPDRRARRCRALARPFRPGRGLWALLAITMGVWLGTLYAAPPAAAEASSPLGAYQGETVTFPTDPTAGLQPDPCTLSAAGPTLIFSNDPERVPGPGILYRDTVSGPFRVFLFHVNGSPEPLRFGVLMTNPGTAAVSVSVEQAGKAGPGTDPLVMGKQAVHLWFQPRSLYTYTVYGHHSVFLDAAIVDSMVPSGDALAAVVDALSSGPVVITTLAESVPSLTTAGMRVLPNTSVSGPDRTPMRGTFPGADLQCAVTAQLPLAGMLQVRLGSPRSYLHGSSAVDGGRPTVDAGNYGVMYDVTLSLTANPASQYGQYALLLHAHNSVFAGVAGVAGEGGLFPAIVALPSDQPSVHSAVQAVMLGMTRLLPWSPTTLNLQWMAAGGSTLPVDLLVYPVY